MAAIGISAGLGLLAVGQGVGVSESVSGALRPVLRYSAPVAWTLIALSLAYLTYQYVADFMLKKGVNTELVARLPSAADKWYVKYDLYLFAGMLGGLAVYSAAMAASKVVGTQLNGTVDNSAMLVAGVSLLLLSFSYAMVSRPWMAGL